VTSLKLEVDRLSVELATLAGEKRRAAFFFPVPDSATSPLSCLVAQLNDAGVDFLPCRVTDRTELIRAEWIAYITVADDQVDWTRLDEAGAIPAAVELELVTGERVAGTLMMDGPEYARRVSDYLNRGSTRFLLLRTGGEAVYINRRALARVHLQEP
jgi:hypothetical protein